MHDVGMFILGAGCGGVLTTWGFSIRGLVRISKHADAQEKRR